MAATGEVRSVRRALVAVADKTGLVPLARGLADRGVELVSSGGTAAALRKAGVPVTPVSEVTGHPEILGGRVKTLHPRIHGGILADRSNPEHVAELEELGIAPFDLVVVNLYPFRETVAAGAGPAEAIERIDIGGPAMVRAAAKNHGSVGVVVRPERYAEVLEEIVATGGLRASTRRALAAEAFAHTAAYDAAVAAWFGSGGPAGDRDAFPAFLGLSLEKVSELRYGENPHQPGGLYRLEGAAGPLGGARVLQGKEMSFNNWLDAAAARGLAWSLPAPAAVIVKHANPCGTAVAGGQEEAYRAALAGDPVSAFGGVVALNAEMEEATARAMSEVFTEVVVAPAFSAGAREILAGKVNLRLVEAPAPAPGRLDVRVLEGGAVVQVDDAVTEGRDEMEVATSRQPSEEEWRDLLLAWTVAAHVRSNAIVLAAGRATVGVGAGQMSRVDAVDIAVRKAGSRAGGAAMGSDAFFPFRDGIDRAAEAGVTAVIQPGGSVRDEEVLRAAEEHGMAMVITGRRHFRH
ncbi:MAG: bifunctional phosphoribosylaminoimidazolecarboxamide formyltransferase/IMP cyclohydrolase [Actinobacteria bacterium]|nr:bifunctional phosphoribosylaminoimidazolecarboxamide formyltransferase/IMP cyclohydrolase [Actinomycetota bacterium]